MVRECEKPGGEDFDAVVQPPLWGVGYTHHGGSASLSVARHSRKRVDHLHVMAEFLKQMNMVFDKDAPCRISRNGVKQRDDEDLNGETSSVECLVNFSEVIGHAGSVVEEA